ncbi:cation-translocating P-type ATPase [Aquibium oceanicum]|uniref:Nitrogen fixation protein FixI n=1 Tax=Aquibium oceanicum TaxID=1670800 RepID=A0A1L3SUB5_9HYPH|nr:cation-translocating P-type ATPase [Aquibium oceanicum]APH72905.1 nitrogen fixation protein FixI [Aquibium oceanicum]
MSCCAPGVETAAELDKSESSGPSAEELLLSSRAVGEGLRQTDLSVPGVHCGACIHAIETALSKLDGVESARVNLSARRVSVRWREDTMPPIVETLNRTGYAAHLFDELAEGKDRALAELVRATGIAGFAAANIMLLSVSVWSGAEDATRDLFHWISALIALPALYFAGGIFYRSAWNALRHGTMNMDVPIALGVTLAYALSLYDTINHGQEAYFDAAVSLLFFLLIGRTLDHVMRDRARTAVTGLARLAPRGAMRLRDDGTREYLPVNEIEPGMRLHVAAGERIPVDGVVAEGASDLDCALVTGESAPQYAGVGEEVRAGMLNLTGPLVLKATARSQDSFLAEMIHLMGVAEGGRARYRRIADRASALYSPVVHLTALVTFVAWFAVSGDFHKATTIAIAVLIITCPCALGLAVPIVQVVAARRLFEEGIMVKDGSAMERLAEIDHVAFDKTGTLTMGRSRLTNASEIGARTMALAASLARHSRHPLSKAIVAAAGNPVSGIPFDEIREIPGCGVEAVSEGSVWRLGRAGWALRGDGRKDLGGETVLSRDGERLARFDFEDQVRTGAARAVADLRQAGCSVEILSGDARPSVASLAVQMGVETHSAEMLPAGKAERLRELADQGRKTMMVGDGLNDSPALAAAHVSMAPSTAADIGRNAADFVFLRDSLTAAPHALAVSRKAGRLIRQNLGLAIVYNAVAVPVAISGHVTPLIAAVAMSASSILVIANAMHLHVGNRAEAEASPATDGIKLVAGAA